MGHLRCEHLGYPWPFPVSYDGKVICFPEQLSLCISLSAEANPDAADMSFHCVWVSALAEGGGCGGLSRSLLQRLRPSPLPQWCGPWVRHLDAVGLNRQIHGEKNAGIDGFT